MKWSLYLGKIAGIKLFVHWTFLILLVWVFYLYFQIGQNLQEAWIGVGFILALFACVTLHEFGHALTAKRFHCNTSSIILLPIGGMAQMEKLPEKPLEEFLVAVAGPMVNVVIAGILYLYLGRAEISLIFNAEHLTGANFLSNLFVANIALVVFNLIPAFPMDGGRILRALLSIRLERGKATRIAASIGQVIAVLFALAGLFFNPMLIFIAFFIFLGAGAEAAFETTKSVLSRFKVSDAMMRNYTPVKVDEPLSKAVKLLLDGQEQEFLVMNDGEVSGILTRNEIIRGLSEFSDETPVSEVMNKNFIVLNPQMKLQEAYQKMEEKHLSVSPVFENNELVAVMDTENIKELLMVREAIKEQAIKNQ